MESPCQVSRHGNWYQILEMILWYSIAVHSRKHTVRVLLCQRVGDCTNSVVYWKKFHFLQLDFDLVKLSNFERWPADNWWKLYILRTRFFPPALSTKLLGWTFAVNPHFVFLLPKRLWSFHIRYAYWSAFATWPIFICNRTFKA